MAETASKITVPEPLLAALQAAFAAKADADARLAARAGAAQALTDAQAADAQAVKDMATAAANLDAARKALEAAEDHYLLPGALTAARAPGADSVTTVTSPAPRL